MAGIGVRLNQIFRKNTIMSDLVGFVYSTVITIAPMLIMITALMLMQQIAGLSKIAYAESALFSCTVLYIFIFAMLTTAPFNAVLSRYLSDVIYLEQYDDIRPCYELGLLLNLSVSCLLGIPFCLREHFAGNVPVEYVMLGFCGYVGMVMVNYSTLYLSVCKDYRKISLYYTMGMLMAVGITWLVCKRFQWDTAKGLLFALASGIFIIAVLENTLLRQYFQKSSNRFAPVLAYFRKYWKLVVANTLYTLGLYLHNFVFWTTDLRMEVANSFVCNQPYDLASCLAMFTNLSATIIFISRVEMNFHEKYRDFSDAITGGRGSDIEIAKNQMFRVLGSELMVLVRIQFVVSVVLYFLFMIVLPEFGVSGMVMQIYPMLAGGYFILFVMYYAMIYQYYFNDLDGAVLTSLVFCVGTLVGSLFATHLSVIWYGSGLTIGAFAGWSTAYERLRWMEQHLYEHIFCTGDIIKRGMGEEPDGQVYQHTRTGKEDVK